MQYKSDLTIAEIEEALKVCREATAGPWGYYGNDIVASGSDLSPLTSWEDFEYLAATRDPVTGYEAALQALARCYALADDLTERADSERRGGRHGDAVELLGIARLIRATIEGR